jgi:hypothetical protein
MLIVPIYFSEVAVLALRLKDSVGEFNLGAN